ncbi:MAG TPA: hypothetical protein VI387_12995 [Candidatus Brocadiales bacterium]|nr:hypothetical protein [Candidatus Brocadiales bacterium]
MDKRNVLIILIAALIVIGIYNFYHFSGRRRSQPTLVASKPRPAVATKKTDRNPEKPIEKTKKFYFPEGWGRNPFLTPAEIKQIQASKDSFIDKESEAVIPLPEYVVTSILISSAQKVAVIDGKIVSPGDSVGREIVKKISTEGVELAMGNNLRTIKLRQGRTEIKTRHLTPTLTLPPGGGGKGEGGVE